MSPALKTMDICSIACEVEQLKGFETKRTQILTTLGRWT